jgi:hypothetical protein
MITEARIESVLRTYSNQLQRSNSRPRLEDDQVTISEEEKRRSIMEQIPYQAMEQAFPRVYENCKSDDMISKRYSDATANL